jgi:hypothetical protein
MPGNGSVNTFQHATREEAVFSMWSAIRNSMGAAFAVRDPCRRFITDTENHLGQLSSEVPREQ